MLSECSHRSLGGRRVLGQETGKSNHGEASILDLLELPIVRVHVEEVESRVGLLLKGSVGAEALGSSERDGHEGNDLDNAEGVLHANVGGLGARGDCPSLRLVPVAIA